MQNCSIKVLPQASPQIAHRYVSGALAPIINSFLQNIYVSLLRCSWQWRNIKHHIHAGLAHEPGWAQKPGDLTVFCAACPQEGINLPPLEDRDNDHPCVFIFSSMLFSLTKLIFAESCTCQHWLMMVTSN